MSVYGSGAGNPKAGTRRLKREQWAANESKILAPSNPNDPAQATIRELEAGTGEGGGSLDWFPGDESPPVKGAVVQAPGVISGRFRRNFNGPVQADWFGVVHHATRDNGPDIQTALDHLAEMGKRELTFSDGELPIVIETPVTLKKITNELHQTRGQAVHLVGQSQRGCRVFSAVQNGYAFEMDSGGQDYFLCRDMGFYTSNAFGGGIFQMSEGLIGSFTRCAFSGIAPGFWAINNEGTVSTGQFSLNVIECRFSSENGSGEYAFFGGAVNSDGTHGLIMDRCYVNAVKTDTFQTGHASKVTDPIFADLDAEGFAIDQNGYRKPLGVIRALNVTNVSFGHITLEGRPTTGPNHGMHFVVFEGFCGNVNVKNVHGESTCTAYFRSQNGNVRNFVCEGGLFWNKTIQGHFNPNWMIWDGSGNDKIKFIGMQPKTDDTSPHDPTTAGYHYNDEGYLLRRGDNPAEVIEQNDVTSTLSGAQADREFSKHRLWKNHRESSFIQNTLNTINYQHQLKTPGVHEISVLIFRTSGTTEPFAFEQLWRVHWIPDYETGSNPVTQAQAISGAVSTGVGAFVIDSVDMSVNEDGLVSIEGTLAGAPVTTATYRIVLTTQVERDVLVLA